MIFFLLSTLRHSHIIANSPPPPLSIQKGFMWTFLLKQKMQQQKSGLKPSLHIKFG